MKTLTVGEFKSRFSAVLQDVRKGCSVGVSYGRKEELVAVLVPPDALKPASGLKLGLLANKARFRMNDDFKMSDEEFLSA